ncbi:putative Actin [Paratrimastix pyriformis]|uniref:Actin n=1 Tax=Paratrimastix pyriformis TaxID=342808 RepID=A0ABQ8UHA1_9EUKA|nr:putative Actin [Paratrimastix pyriformis]
MEQAPTLLNQAIVLDNGSGSTKVGFAGDDFPKAVFPAYVGRPKHVKVMGGGLTGLEFLVGARAEKSRGLLKLAYPITHGIVQNWDDMEKIWHAAFEELKSEAREHPILLTEAPLNPYRNRERAAEKLFETFGVPALFVSLQAMLTLYASGSTSGVVLDCGDGVCHSVPVVDGFAVPSAIQRIDIGGRDVTNHLQQLLRRSGHGFHSSAELEIVREIKEKTCYVAVEGLRAEEQRFMSRMQQSGKPTANPMACDYASLDAERFRAAEALFDPALLGTEFRGVHQKSPNKRVQWLQAQRAKKILCTRRQPKK